jgi:hypothetical protein
VSALASAEQNHTVEELESLAPGEEWEDEDETKE